MATYYGICIKCGQVGTVYLETLVNHPPLNCKACGGEIACSSKPPPPVEHPSQMPTQWPAPASPVDTPHATVTHVGPPIDDMNSNGSAVYLSQGRREFAQRMLARAFGDERGLAGYTEV